MIHSFQWEMLYSRRTGLLLPVNIDRPDRKIYITTDEYRNRQHSWYGKVRSLLQDFGRTYIIEVSLQTVKSCSLIWNVLPIHAWCINSMECPYL